MSTGYSKCFHVQLNFITIIQWSSQDFSHYFTYEGIDLKDQWLAAGLLTSKWRIKVFYLKPWSEVKLLSHVWFFVTPWTVAYQAPPSMGFSRQEYWSGLPFPSPGDLPDPEIKPRSPTLQADALTSEPPGRLLYWLLNTERQILYHFIDMWNLQKPSS